MLPLTPQFTSRKVAIVGAGRVGSHVAIGLLTNQLVDEIVLLDVNAAAAQAEVLDLKDFCTALHIHTFIHAGTYDDCADARFVVVTAGRHRRPGESRLDMLDGTFRILEGIVGPLKDSGFHGTLITVSNPVDVVSEYLYRETGLPRNRCFGTGTALDTIRLQRIMGNILGVERDQINAPVLGEHGDSSFIARSHCSVAGIPLKEYLRIWPEDESLLQMGSILSTVRGSGGAIIAGKGATEFGIGGTVASIISAILHNERRIMTLSAHLSGEYGERDVSVGVPCLVGDDGIESVLELELGEDEKEALRKSCDVIRQSLVTIER